MSWLDDLLTKNHAAAAALLTASQAGPETNTYGATGGTLAPSQTGPEQAATASDSSPLGQALRQLVAGYQSWAQRHGGAAEPLAAAGKMVSAPVQTDQVTDPLTRALAGSAQVNTVAGGPRQGLGFQEYDLGGGQFAHVYYDKNGKRQVFKFTRAQPSG